jgi:hypothetical protein
MTIQQRKLDVLGLVSSGMFCLLWTTDGLWSQAALAGAALLLLVVRMRKAALNK